MRGVAVVLVADVTGTCLMLRSVPSRVAVTEETRGNQQQSVRVVRERLDAADQLEAARAEAALGLVAVDRALGGGWGP